MSSDLLVSVVLPSAGLVLALGGALWGLAGLGRKQSPTSGPKAEEPSVTDERQLTLQQPTLERLLRPTLQGLARRARRFTPTGWVTALERRVRLAGFPEKRTVDRILAAKLLMGIAILIIGVLWVARLSTSGGSLALTLGRLALVPVLALIVYMLPDLFLRSRGAERQRIVQASLPDALDQMTISVEAGLGFDAAVQRVVEAGKGPLVEELRRALREISIGVPRRQAFRDLAQSTNVAELRHFVFAVIQAEDYGLPIANVLRVQSRELRVIRRQRAEERALKIPVKIVLPLVLCIFPPLLIVVLVPALMRIMETIGG